MSDQINITVDDQDYEIVDAAAAPLQARTVFDYLPWTAIDDGSESASLVRRGDGTWFDLGEFERVDGANQPSLVGWDGWTADTFFSGILVRFLGAESGYDYGDFVKLATYCAGPVPAEHPTDSPTAEVAS
jgi:hypothetical protein